MKSNETQFESKAKSIYCLYKVTSHAGKHTVPSRSHVFVTSTELCRDVPHIAQLRCTILTAADLTNLHIMFSV